MVDEISLIRDYISLEKLRYGDRLDVEITEKIQDKSIGIPPLLFLPFIENAFKHGASQSTSEKIKIEIQIEQRDQIITFYCANPQNTPSDKHAIGIGLKNICQRLKLQFPDKHLLEFKENNDIYSVYLTLEI